MAATTDERRKTGSHYTPRTLTEPIVRKAFEPILKQLGDTPTPDQVLGLKVCDLAMGSGAFLVEACRQLGDELVNAWHTHGWKPVCPPDEDEVLHARRIVAQRCLYGLDRNPMAVDLAKLSMWLATLAKDHPFTFLDHSLRAGDEMPPPAKAQNLGGYKPRFLARKLARLFGRWYESLQVLQSLGGRSCQFLARLRQRLRRGKQPRATYFCRKSGKLRKIGTPWQFLAAAGPASLTA